jgi:hypothetical protein
MKSPMARGLKICSAVFPDLSKAKRLIGYQPTRTLDNIITDVVREFRDGLTTESAGA